VSIPQETIKAIRDRVSLPDLISETVQLKRTGKNYLGLCPFHSEKSPSFNVNAEEGFYKCFGCSKHGSAFDFVMETKGLTFVEAVKFLGARVGIEVRAESQEMSESRKKEEERRKVLRTVLREVVRLGEEQLESHPESGAAKRYLKERGVKEGSIKLFQIGFIPDDRTGVSKLIKIVAERTKLEESAVEQHLILLGVLGRSESGILYETFRGRIIFPILRSDGVPVALGGRILEAHPNRPKYINSKESPIYSKRQTLYGLSHAVPYARRERQVILVEGYMDVIALAQAGFPAAIATCGTSITNEHVEVLRRFCDRVIVVMDSDSAGQKAAANCFELFLNSGIEVYGLQLPEGEDPGSFLIGKRLAKFDDPLNAEALVAAEFEELLKSKTEPILKSYLNNLLLQAHAEPGEASPAAIGKISTQFVKLLGKIKNPVEREGTLRLGATILGVSKESLTSLQRSTPSERPSNPPTAQKALVAKNVEPKQSRPVKETVSTLSQKLTLFIEQMIIAVICEPSLSRSLLEMEDSLRQLATENFPLSQIKRFLTAVKEEDFVGLSNFKGRENNRDFRAYLMRFSKLLGEFGLDGKSLLSKAWSQVAVGGNQPEIIVSQAAQFSREFSLSSQVEVLKTKERESQDPVELGELLQRKLLERRKLRI
jgi:DNA primase